MQNFGQNSPGLTIDDESSGMVTIGDEWLGLVTIGNRYKNINTTYLYIMPENAKSVVRQVSLPGFSRGRGGN